MSRSSVLADVLSPLVGLALETERHVSDGSARRLAERRRELEQTLDAITAKPMRADDEQTVEIPRRTRH